MLTNKLNFNWLIVVLLGVILTSCDFVNSIKEIINPQEENTSNNPPTAKTDLEEKLFSTNWMDVKYRVAVYCVEEEDNPLAVYDLFDFDFYYGSGDSLHYGFSSDGLEYTITAGVNQVDKFILNELDIEVEFSEDHSSIERFHAYNDYDELYYIDDATRQLQYELTIEDPIKILTANSDSIEMMEGITYYTEMVDTSHYEFWAKEIFKDETQSNVFWNYIDTKGTERYLKIEVFFRLY